MRLLRILRHRLRTLFHRQAVDDDLQRELSLHLDLLARETMADGASHADARRAARLAFGSIDLVTEQCRDTRRLALFDDLLRDLTYAIRGLARSPGFAVTAILSLALGLGANTAIFSLVDAVLLRSLPVQHPQELVFIQAAGTAGPNGAPPYPCFDRLRREATSFSAMSAFAADDLTVTVDGRVEQVFGQVVSGNYFDTLGLHPLAGRLLTADDERLSPAVAAIGYGYALRRFGSAGEAVGKTLSFRNATYTIVGVTPPEFWGLQPGRQIDVSLPITLERTSLTDAGNFWFEAVARLRPDVTAEQARAQADTIYQSFAKDVDWSAETRHNYFDHIELSAASRGLDRLRTRFSKPLFLLTLVASVVLLIACINLSNLLLVRNAARSREFAIRLATGAGASRLIRQLATETLLLFALGAVSGLLCAYGAVQALTSFFATGRNPIVLDVAIDWRLIGFATLVPLVTGLLSAIWPVLQALQIDPHPAIREGDSRLVSSRRLGRARHVLISGQVALSLALLIAATMFTKTLMNLRAVDLGFSARGILTMSLIPAVRGDDSFAGQHVWKDMLSRVRALPGVHTASLSALSPLSGRDSARYVTVAAFQPRREEDRLVHVNHVSEDYFQTFGIALSSGRTFTSSDSSGAPNVVVLNETAARTYFGNRNPIGETVRFSDTEAYQVVGVVRDAKESSVRQAAPRFMFVPIWQPLQQYRRLTLAVSSPVAPATLASTVAREIHAIDSGTLVSDVITLDDQLDATLVSERLLSMLGASFAVLALGLAAVGTYGVLSYAVSKRRVEFGLRMALGALPAQVVWAVSREVVVQVVVGIAIGLPLAVAAARTAEGLLYGVSVLDPVNYLAAVAVLAVVVCVASSLPTLQACAIDPSEALRRD